MHNEYYYFSQKVEVDPQTNKHVLYFASCIQVSVQNWCFILGRQQLWFKPRTTATILVTRGAVLYIAVSPAPDCN